MTVQDLSEKEFHSYYGRYIYKIDESVNLREGFEIGNQSVAHFFSSIPSEKHLFRYERDKWTIKQVLQHLIDTERVFMYRCFRIARRDLTPLAGFDQNIYMDPANANEKSMDELLVEFQTGRLQSITMLKSFSDEDLAFVGDANGSEMSARAAAFTVIGHDVWHMEIIKSKYL
jgi:uncharacterized damage-inducible protein DinB